MNAATRCPDSEIAEAVWVDWRRESVYLTDATGNRIGRDFVPRDAAVTALLERGGRIADPGTPADELVWWQRRKIREIVRHAEERLRRNEPHYARRARLARLALMVVSPAPVRFDLLATRYDAETWAAAELYIRHVQAMTSIAALRKFDPTTMAWPKTTT